MSQSTLSARITTLLVPALHVSEDFPFQTATAFQPLKMILTAKPATPTLTLVWSVSTLSGSMAPGALLLTHSAPHPTQEQVNALLVILDTHSQPATAVYHSEIPIASNSPITLVPNALQDTTSTKSEADANLSTFCVENSIQLLAPALLATQAIDLLQVCAR